jgi:hypothetical protein
MSQEGSVCGTTVRVFVETSVDECVSFIRVPCSGERRRITMDNSLRVGQNREAVKPARPRKKKILTFN